MRTTKTLHNILCVTALLLATGAPLLAQSGGRAKPQPQRAAKAALAAMPDFRAAQEEVVRNLAGLIRVDTSNPPGNETKAAEYLKAILEREGIPAEIYALEPDRGNLVARIKGSGKKRPILLMGHTDVVPVERDKWTVDPFTGVIRDGYLYGRGALDDKGMTAAALQVLLLLKRNNVKLDRDVIFLAEAGEEATTRVGIDFMVEKHFDKIDAEFALNEGGNTFVENGKVKYVSVGTAEKISRGFRLVARGTSGHGSVPRLDNALLRLSAAVARVGYWEVPAKLNETTRAFFPRLATISQGEEKSLFENVEKPEVQQKLRVSYPVYYSMMRTSIQPTILKGGFRTNVVPAEGEATFDVRAVPDENIEALMAKVKELVNDPGIEIVRNPIRRPTNPPMPIDSEMFQALERTQKLMFPDAVTLPSMGTGATDSAQLRAKGVQAYGINTLSTEDDRKRVHGNDERISMDGLGKFVEFLYRTVVEVAGAK